MRVQCKFMGMDESFIGGVAHLTYELGVPTAQDDVGRLCLQSEIFVRRVDETTDLIEMRQEKSLNVCLPAKPGMLTTLEELQDLLLIRQRLLRREPDRECQLLVGLNSLSVKAGRPDDISDGLAVVPPADNLPHIHDACLSIRHRSAPVVGDR